LSRDKTIVSRASCSRKEKSYQAGCLAYYKGKATPAVVLYTIIAELTEKRATKRAACSRKVLHSTLSILLGVYCFLTFFIIPYILIL